VNRTELVARLRELYVAHQGGSDGLYRHRDCDWCASRMARVMAVVDEYVTALSAGPSATRYRRGSIIRQAVPHREYADGARRWHVWGVEDGDYIVQALFSDGSPMTARWPVEWCEAATELEWQDDEVGRIGKDGVCVSSPPKGRRSRKEREGDALQAADRRSRAQVASEADPHSAGREP
jgi:hypothetical protein